MSFHDLEACRHDRGGSAREVVVMVTTAVAAVL